MTAESSMSTTDITINTVPAMRSNALLAAVFTLLIVSGFIVSGLVVSGSSALAHDCVVPARVVPAGAGGPGLGLTIVDTVARDGVLMKVAYTVCLWDDGKDCAIKVDSIHIIPGAGLSERSNVADPIQQNCCPTEAGPAGCEPTCLPTGLQ
jgi:hypothetical protein